MAEEKTTKGRLFEFIAAKSDAPSGTVAPVVSADIGAGADHGEATAAGAAASGAASFPAVVKPAAQTVAAAQKPEEDVFLTNIFEKKISDSAPESKLMKGLIETEEKHLENRSILGKAPEIDTKLFIDIEYHLEKKLAAMKTSFIAVCAVFVLLIGFSYSALDPEFSFLLKENIGTKFEDANANLKNMQTESNKLYYQTFKQLLDQFAFTGVGFTQKYNEHQLASSDKKPAIMIELDNARKSLTDKFDEISSHTSRYKNYRDIAFDREMSPAEAEAYFNQLLRESLAAENNPENKTILSVIENQDADGKKALAGIFHNKKSSDFKTDFDLIKVVNSVNANYKSDITFFSRIKNARVKWSEYLNEINKVTKASDPDYRPELFGSTFSAGVGIKYSGFTIDDNNSIKISGVAVTVDSATFTLLAKLLDGFKNSKALKNPEMRTFFKNVSQQDSKYTSNFTITAELNPEWNNG